jgi:hypothetical protein
MDKVSRAFLGAIAILAPIFAAWASAARGRT